MMGAVQKSLGELTETRVEQTGPKAREFTYVDIGSIALNTKRIVDPKVLSVSKTPSRAKQVLKTGDVLVSMTRPNRNAVALVPPELDGAIGSTGFHVLRAKEVEPGFLFYAVQTNDFIDALCEKVQGALYPAVRPRDVSSFSTFLPTSLTEQKRIVAEIEKQFTRLEAGMTALRRVQANLKRYRAAVLKAACEGRLVPTEAVLAKTVNHKSKFETGEELLVRILAERRKNWQGRGKYKEPIAPDFTNLPKLPESWSWVSWEMVLAYEAGAFKRGPFGSALTKSIFVQQGFKIYEQYCPINDDCSFARYYITEEKFKELQSFEVKAGDYLISCSGITLGRITRVPEQFERGIINQALLRVRINEDVINHRYFLHLFRSALFQKAIFDNSTGSAIPNVKGVKELKAMAIPLPPLAEQTRIVAEVERRLSVVEELEVVVSANLQRATRLRQSILQKAFVGELVAQPSAAPATNIIALPKPERSQPPNAHFARALLSAEIVHRLHCEPTFGRIKHQKIFHLCEHIAQIEEIKGQYHREAAGPLDNKLIYANEAELKKQKWYQEKHRDSYGHAYEPLPKAGNHRKYLEGYWPDKLPLVEKLIELMRTWKTDRCEIFCTTYAAWNDLILWGKEATEDAILHEILESWHPSKKRFPEEQWRSAIGWMRQKGFVPTGFGKPTAKSK